MKGKALQKMGMKYIFCKRKKNFQEGMFATSSVCRLEQTKDERRKRNNQQIGTEMPGMFNVEQIQHSHRKKYNVQSTTW